MGDSAPADILAPSGSKNMDQIFWDARRTKPSRIGDAKRNEIRRIVTHVIGSYAGIWVTARSGGALL
jgi:hypothetical protein